MAGMDEKELQAAYDRAWFGRAEPELFLTTLGMLRKTFGDCSGLQTMVGRFLEDSSMEEDSEIVAVTPNGIRLVRDGEVI